MKCRRGPKIIPLNLACNRSDLSFLLNHSPPHLLSSREQFKPAILGTAQSFPPAFHLFRRRYHLPCSLPCHLLLPRGRLTPAASFSFQLQVSGVPVGLLQPFLPPPLWFYLAAEAKTSLASDFQGCSSPQQAAAGSSSPLRFSAHRRPSIFSGKPSTPPFFLVPSSIHI